jgi:Pentapeptide repeats (8 copies)
LSNNPEIYILKVYKASVKILTLALVMPQDFSSQNLRGRSFKGQNLKGADFSSADIRGTNFTGANLQGANFRGAFSGLEKRWVIVLVSISWLLERRSTRSG